MRSLALSAAALVGTLTLMVGSPVAHAAPQTETTNTGSNIVTVQPGDYLSAIATTHGTTAQRLFDANTSIENPDLIYPGDQVRIPTPDEQLATRQMPTAYVAPAAPAPVATESAESPYQAPAAAPTAPAAPAVAAPTVASGSVWDQLAQCESSGNWAADTGNGFYGGLQFTLSSWQAVGGSGSPSNASREEQIMRAQTLQAMQGWGAWPACTAKLGLR